MKTVLSIALVFAFAASAAAHDGPRKPHHKRVHHVRQQPAPRDPNAAYWNDPGRQAPPFSYFGDVH